MWALAASAASIAAAVVAIVVALTKGARRVFTLLDSIADNTKAIGGVLDRLERIEQKVDDRNGRA